MQISYANKYIMLGHAHILLGSKSEYLSSPGWIEAEMCNERRDRHWWEDNQSINRNRKLSIDHEHSQM